MRRQMAVGVWPRRGRTALGKSALVMSAVAGLLFGFQGPAWAAGTLYPAGTDNGYDVSYPNCGTAAPASDAFAIVGLGGGRPFSLNSCAGSEFAAAENSTSGDAALYFNTGYAGAYGRDIDRTCQANVANAGVFAGLTGHSLKQAQQAWEIGCSEADFAWSNEPGTPVMWWADVETGNSWSTNTALNRYTIDGISYQMGARGGGGFYSSPAMWASITGGVGWSPTPASLGTWAAGSGNCSTLSFGGAETWIVQGGAANGYDLDSGCQ